jgi:hypothetical protein
MHTVGDNLVPVTGENQYGRQVAKAGASRLLRQAYVERAIHCNFTPAELVAGVLAVHHRVQTGRWEGSTTPQALNGSAASLALGAAAFVDYRPGEMIGQNTRSHRGPGSGAAAVSIRSSVRPPQIPLRRGSAAAHHLPPRGIPALRADPTTVVNHS